MKKIICVLLMLIMITAAAPVLFATELPSSAFSVTDSSGNPLNTPSGTTKINQQIGFKPNNGNIVSRIDIITSTDISTFPFSIEKTDYSKPPTVNGTVYVYDFNMNRRSGASDGYYNIPFLLTLDGGDTCTIYVVMELKGGSTAPPSNMPKITITSFKTLPDPVVAGEEITLNVSFKNNTNGTVAKNVKAQLSSDGTFTPVSGSSSLFLGDISGGSTVSRSIKLKVKADVAPGSYTVTFALSYDVDGAEVSQSDSETVSVPVVQVPKVQVTQIQIYPSEVYTGQEMNVMASINNIGKSTIFNVNAQVSDSGGLLEAQEQYLGNLTPGATGSLDVYLLAVMDGGTDITITITYENEEGDIFTYTDTQSIFITTRGEFIDPIPYPDPVDRGGSIVLIIIIVLIVLAGGGLVAFLLIRRKKKTAVNKERDLQQVAELERRYYSEQQAAMAEQATNGGSAAQEESSLANTAPLNMGAAAETQNLEIPDNVSEAGFAEEQTL